MRRMYLRTAHAPTSLSASHDHKKITSTPLMHQSIPVVPIPPPGQPPGIRMANSRGWGQVSPSNAPGWDQNRRQMPHPRDHLESNTAQDFNNKS